jgi:hypothetical protein
MTEHIAPIKNIMDMYPYTCSEKFNEKYGDKTYNYTYEFQKGNLILSTILPFDVKYVAYTMRIGSFSESGLLENTNKLLELFDHLNNSTDNIEYFKKNQII